MHWLVVVLVALAGMLSAYRPHASPPPQRPSSTILSGRDELGELTIRLDHTFFKDTEPPTFGRPLAAVVDGDGRSFRVDRIDKDVKVLDAAGDVEMVLGRAGEGPGEFRDIWLPVLRPDSPEIWVFDRSLRQFVAFDTRTGAYIDGIEIRPAGIRSPLGLVFLDPHRIAVATPENPLTDWNDPPLHVLELRSVAGRRTLEVVTSFGRGVEIEPMLRTLVGGGWLASDGDAGLVFTQATPHSIQGFGRDLQPSWHVSDPDLLPPATSFFEVSLTGRWITRPFPQAATVVALGQRSFLHVMVFPPDLPLEVIRATRPEMARKVEYIEVSVEGTVARRMVFDTEAPLLYTGRSASGDLYGLWDNHEHHPVWSTVNVRGRVPLAERVPRAPGAGAR